MSSNKPTWCCTDNVVSSSELPSTLTGPPTKSLVPPENCQFGEEFAPVPLLAKFQVSPTSFVLRFGLPDTTKSLGLSTCACLLAGVKVDGEEGELIVRPYTPISTNAMTGSFDLLVKAYPDGKMSQFMTNLTPSPTEKPISFKHIKFNVKKQYPFDSPKFVGILAGGTGVTPMIQALHAILGEEDADQAIEKVSMLYGSRNSNDILGKEMLDVWAKSHKEKLTVTHLLSDEPEDSTVDKDDESIQRGFITKELIAKSFPGPDSGKDTLIFVCGPPIMYDILCGPRGESEITGVLGEMGYTPEQVYKF